MLKVTGWMGLMLGALLGCAPESASPPATTAAQVQASGAWARATPPGAPVGAAYLQLHNAGSAPDALIAMESPRAARVELHATEVQDGMAMMRRLERLELPPGATVALQPGGLHLMLLDLSGPLAEGEEFPLTLGFERAPAITVAVRIAALGAAAPPGDR